MKAIGHKERFLQALKLCQPDRVPLFELIIDRPIVLELVKLLGLQPDSTGKNINLSKEILEPGLDENYVKLYSDVIENLNLDAVCYPFSLGMERLSQTEARDKYGRVFRLSPHGQPLPVPAKPRVDNFSQAKEFDMAAKMDIGDFAGLQQIVNRFGGSRACVTTLTDPFKVGWRSTGGMQRFLMDFVRNPKIIHQLLQTATDYLQKAVDITSDIGIDGFIMDGDFADEKGLIFSQVHYRKYLKKLHEKTINYVHKKGKFIIKHSDGNFWPLIDDWMEVGFDGLHPIQPQCMDIKEVKDYVGRKMAIVGNIDCRTLLVTGSVDEVTNTVKETIEKVAPGGGYIVSSSNSIHPGIKPENYIAMVKAVHKYGSYR